DNGGLSLMPAELELRAIFSAVSDYFNNMELRKTIPYDSRSNIENQLSSIATSFNQYISERNANTANFRTNRPSYIQQIRSFFNNLYQPLILPREIFNISHASDNAQLVEEAAVAMRTSLSEAQEIN